MRTVRKLYLARLIRWSFMLVALCSCFLTGHGQSKMSRKDSMKVDLATLRDSLAANYPSLYRYNTAKQIARLYAGAAERMDDHTTDLQFFKEIRFIVSRLKDGHLYAQTSAPLSKYLKTEAVFFPLSLHFNRDKVLLTNPLSDKHPAGTQLLSINGRAVSAIKNELFNYIAGDGNITSKKILILNNVFHFYYLLAYGKQQKFQIQLKTPDGTIEEETVQAVHESDLPVLPEKTDSGKLLQFEITGDSIAVLRIKSFDKSALLENGLNFPLFVQTAFDRLNKNKIDRLIIDLRDNGGGTDLYGALLYQYLAASPFYYYQQLSVITDKLPYPKLSDSTSSFNNLQSSMLTKTAGGFILKQQAHANLALQHPASHPYKGRVVFLINGLTFSTAAEFCAIAKSKKRGLFVGQETAGTCEGNTSGIQKEITLANSGIDLSFGLIQYQMAVNKNQNGRGVVPDHAVSPTLLDISTHQDPELNFAFKLLR